MADQIDVVVQVAHKVLADVLGGAARVADELALGHLVLHVWAAEVDGEQDERVAQHVHGICNTQFTLFKNHCTGIRDKNLIQNIVEAVILVYIYIFIKHRVISKTLQNVTSLFRFAFFPAWT